MGPLAWILPAGQSERQSKETEIWEIYLFFLYCHILCGLTLRPQSCRCTLDHIHKFPIRSYWQTSSGTSWCFHRFMYSWGLSWCWRWCTLNDIHKFPIRSYWQASFGMSCCLDGRCRHWCG